jgi:urease subunit alpha
MADLVLWPRASFGIKPWLVIKRGFVTWSAMGDGNGSWINAEPVIHRPMWGALGSSKTSLGVTFVSRLAMEADIQQKLGVQKAVLPIRNIRKISKKDMLHNGAMPDIEVNPQTFDVYADGKLLKCDPVKKVPLCRRYMLR